MLFKGPKSLLDSITNVIKEERAQYAKEQAEMDKLVAEKMLSPKQKKIAAVAGDKSKIDAADFVALRAGKQVKEEAEEVDLDEAYIHMPVYDKYITDVRRKKGGGSMNFGEFANHHGMDKVPHIINDLKKERNELINKHKSIKVAMLHDRAISGLKSAAKEHAQQNEEIEHLDEISDKAKRDYLSKIPASVTKIQKNAEKEITTNPDQGKGLSNALKGLAKINKRGEIANKVRQSLKNEATDTPGNGREHQCAIHVKNEQFGEGKTLTTQHAEPDENGDIAWYDVMFDHGIERVMTEDLDILVSEAHVHNKPRKGM